MIRTVRQLFFQRLLASMLILASTATATVAAAEATTPALAWQWWINGDDDIMQIELTESVYRHISRNDLGDLIAMDANGHPIPMAPISQIWAPPPVRRELPLRSVPLFRLPSDPGSGTGSEAIRLHIKRNADGRLIALDASVEPGQASEPTSCLLLDLSALDTPYNALQLALDPPDESSFTAKVRVAGSDDFSRWNDLGTHSVLQLRQHGISLVHDRLDLPASGFNYLRLCRIDGGPLPVSNVQVRPLPLVEVKRAAPPPLESLRLGPESRAAEPGVYYYRSIGPIPVSRVGLETTGENTVSAITISSRSDDRQDWHERARFTLYDIELDGARLHSDPASIRGKPRDRLWRVQTRPPLRAAPVLRLDYRPDRFVILAQGPRPYRIAAGSATVTRKAYPMDVVLAAIRGHHAGNWRPPFADLQRGAKLAGASALSMPVAADKPLPVRQIVLWIVLLGGAGLVMVLVISLLRQAPDNDAQN